MGDRFLPASAQVLVQGAGEAELGVGGQDQPGPALALGGSADLRRGPAQCALDQPDPSPGVSLGADGISPAFAQLKDAM